MDNISKQELEYTSSNIDLANYLVEQFLLSDKEVAELESILVKRLGINLKSNADSPNISSKEQKVGMKSANYRPAAASPVRSSSKKASIVPELKLDQVGNHRP